MSKEIIELESGHIDTGAILKVTIEGESKMPFWNHDLKVTAILALLNSIDIKDYYENNMADEGYASCEEIIKTAKAAFGVDDFEI